MWEYECGLCAYSTLKINRLLWIQPSNTLEKLIKSLKFWFYYLPWNHCRRSKCRRSSAISVEVRRTVHVCLFVCMRSPPINGPSYMPTCQHRVHYLMFNYCYVRAHSYAMRRQMPESSGAHRVPCTLCFKWNKKVITCSWSMETYSFCIQFMSMFSPGFIVFARTAHVHHA